MGETREFCRVLNALREAEEKVRILETHRKARLLSREHLLEPEWHRSVRDELEPLIIRYYDQPEDLPPEPPPHLDRVREA